MKNDPFPFFEFLTQTQMGQLFGVSGRKVGHWLQELGLRSARRPTPAAVEGGLVQVVDDGDMRFYGWHKSLVEVFEAAGHRRQGLEPTQPPEPTPSPAPEPVPTPHQEPAPCPDPQPPQAPESAPQAAPRPSPPPEPPPASRPEPSRITGPFTARGYEIVDSHGLVGVWVRGERLATRLAELMTLADRYNKLN